MEGKLALFCSKGVLRKSAATRVWPWRGRTTMSTECAGNVLPFQWVPCPGRISENVRTQALAARANLTDLRNCSDRFSEVRKLICDSVPLSRGCSSWQQPLLLPANAKHQLTREVLTLSGRSRYFRYINVPRNTYFWCEAEYFKLLNVPIDYGRRAHANISIFFFFLHLFW